MARSILILVVVTLTMGCNSQTSGQHPTRASYERIHVGRSWGFVNDRGDTVIAPGRYDFLNPIDEENMILAHRGDRQGYIDIHEQVLIPFDYEDIGVFSHGLAPAKKDGKFGMVDRTGKLVVQFKYDELRHLYSCGLAKARIGRRWGFVDGSGNERIPLIYDEVDYNKVDPYVAVLLDGKWAFFDGEGGQLTPHRYDEVFESTRADGEYSFFTGGLAKVRVGNHFGYIDRGFQEVISLGAYDEVGAFNADSLAIVVKGGKAGVLHVKGHIVLPLTYDEISHPNRFSHISSNFIARVGISFQLINSKGKPLTGLELRGVELDHSKKADHFIVKSKTGAIGVMAPTGETLVAFVHESMRPFDGRTVAIAQRDGMWGLISINDSIVVPFENTMISTGRFFRYYVVERNGKAGVINEDGQVLLPFEYEAIAPCYYDEENRFIAKRDGSFGLIDLQGKVIIPFEFDSISNWVEYGPDEHICSKNGLFALIARDGSIVVQDLTSEQLAEFLSKR
jgi:hypothetical protein